MAKFNAKLQEAAGSLVLSLLSAAALSLSSWSLVLHHPAANTSTRSQNAASLAHVNVFPSLLIMALPAVTASAAL